MNKQKKVLITITYNEMGIIIDTKAEEVAKPDLQQTCNKLATDTISRQAALDVILPYCPDDDGTCSKSGDDLRNLLDDIENLPSAQPEIVRCKDCKHYQFADNRAFGTPVEMCEWFGFEDVDDDDFCSRAERRADE